MPSQGAFYTPSTCGKNPRRFLYIVTDAKIIFLDQPLGLQLKKNGLTCTEMCFCTNIEKDNENLDNNELGFHLEMMISLFENMIRILSLW